MKFRIRKTKESFCGTQEINYWVEPANPILRFVAWSPFQILLGSDFEEYVSVKSSKEEALEHIKKFNSGYFKTKTLDIEEV